MRSRQVFLTVVVGVVVLFSSGVGAGIVFSTPASMATPPTKTASTHTLVITATKGSGSYTVTASTGLQLTRGEQSDYQLRGPRVTGTIGTGDPKDVIRYTGYIESFQTDGSIHVTLDGREISPLVLGGQHITIRSSTNAIRPTLYRIRVTGRVSPGESAGNGEVLNNRTMRGLVATSNDTDSFYFTGDITAASISINGSATITINGQNASVFLSHPPPTPPATPTPTATTQPPASSTGTPSLSSPAAPLSPTHSPRPTLPSSPSPGHSGDGGWLPFDLTVIVMVAAVLGGVLYRRL
jgi:hypothetical protein